VSQEALAALLCSLAALTLGRSWRRPSIRPAGAGLFLLALCALARFRTFDGAHPRLDVLLSCAWPAVAAVLVLGWWGLVWLAWALFLARWGALLAPWWSWALQGPRLVLGLAVTAVALRRGRRDVGPQAPWPPSQLVGLVLAAGQVAGVLAGLWSRWGEMRILTTAIYGLIAVVVWRARG
jgi:hypothetical protein